MIAASLESSLSALFATSTISELAHLSGGASRDTWRFLADGRPLVVQLQRDGDGRDMAVEIATVRAAHAAGVPVAEIVAASTDEGAAALFDNAFMVFDYVEGETIARKILRDDRFAQARHVLVPQCARALATLHAVPPDAVPALAEVDQLHLYRTTLDSFSDPHPAFELAFRWLEAHRPTRARTAIVHGDFRLGNLMIGDDGLRAVLDWELAHLGDPLEDLGWLCVRAWRFGAPRPVAGLGDYEELCREYEVASGAEVDRDAVRWWEVLGTLKWGIICMMQSHTHLSGAVRSHELAAIGRRVCETEYDLFLALDGRW